MLADLVRAVADEVLTRRGIDPAVLPATVTVRHSRNPHLGDYATDVALQTAPKAGVDPHEFAGWLAEALATSPAVQSAEVAGPGFLNLRLTGEARAEIVRRLLAAPRGGSAVGEQSSSQPGDRVRVVQLAHARLASLARNAADLGITVDDARLQLLEDAREVELVWLLTDFPRIVALGEPRRLLRYLEGLAQYQHYFTDVCRVLPMGDEEPGPLHAARLALGEATMRVLAEGLRLLGTTAPERM